MSYCEVSYTLITIECWILQHIVFEKAILTFIGCNHFLN